MIERKREYTVFGFDLVKKKSKSSAMPQSWPW